MKTKRQFIPPFLNKIDDHLLLNRPDTWSSRFHLLWYFVIVFILGLAGLSYIGFNDPLRDRGVGYWVTLVSLIAFIGFIFWMIYLLRFNVFKRFGNLSTGDHIKTFLLYFLNIGLLVFCGYVTPIVESGKANMKFKDQELLADVNAMNTKVLQLEYDSVEKKWSSDTFMIVKSLADVTTVVETTPGYPEKGIRRVDSAQFNYHREYSDSVIKINDSIYVFMQSPDYMFISPYMSTYEGQLYGLESSKDHYYSIIKNPKPGNPAKIYSELQALLKKYNPDYKGLYQSDGFITDIGYKTRISNKYDLSSTNSNISNLTDKKFRFRNETLPALIRLFFYITFVLTLLVYVFRRSTMRTFFLSLLAAVILLILTSLFTAFARGGTGGMLILCLVYYALFIVLTLVGYYSPTRTAIGGIALNLLVLTTSWVPLVITDLYYDILRRNYSYTYYPEYYENESRNYLYAEISGVILLIILIELVFARLYRRWYALPEQ